MIFIFICKTFLAWGSCQQEIPFTFAIATRTKIYLCELYTVTNMDFIVFKIMTVIDKKKFLFLPPLLKSLCAAILLIRRKRTEESMLQSRNCFCFASATIETQSQI